MKIILAIVIAALSGNAFAQSPPCMPGGTCCINGNCGTLEQFKRNAEIVCLQADAIENKSLPQSIELAGRCMAARIMAQRVEETQQANAQEHQQALDAQRKLREMGAPQASLPTTGQEAMNEVQQVIDECRAKRLSGQLPNYVASVQCSNPRMVQLFSASHYRYMDLIQWLALQRLEVARRIDSHELTDAQGNLENQKNLRTIIETEQRRDSGVR